MPFEIVKATIFCHVGYTPSLRILIAHFQRFFWIFFVDFLVQNFENIAQSCVFDKSIFVYLFCRLCWSCRGCWWSQTRSAGTSKHAMKLSGDWTCDLRFSSPLLYHLAASHNMTSRSDTGSPLVPSQHVLQG